MNDFIVCNEKLNACIYQMKLGTPKLCTITKGGNISQKETDDGKIVS